MWKWEFRLSSDCKPVIGKYEYLITSVSAILLQFKQQRMLYFTPKKKKKKSRTVKTPDCNKAAITSEHVRVNLSNLKYNVFSVSFL